MIKSSGEQCRAHAVNDSDLCVQHLRYPGASPRKPKRQATISVRTEIPDMDWEPKVRAYLDMLGPDEKADTIAALFQIVQAWQIDSGLAPAPEGWVMAGP
jgi:hypothetical protein